MVVPDIDFSEKIALVTGGSRGFGKDIALSLAKNGASVIICGRKEENLNKATEQFRSLGLNLTTVKANVGKSHDVQALFSEVEKKFGRLDLLINNVGMNIFTPSVADTDEALWDKIIETNLKSVFLVSSYASRLMRKSGGGKIVNISSIAAQKASSGMGIYCTAKAGVEMLTRVLAVELAPYHINVNAVAPGIMKTTFSEPLWGSDELLGEVLKTIPLGAIAETSDVVGAVLFLSSDLSNFITGEILTVDGGTMA